MKGLIVRALCAALLGCVGVGIVSICESPARGSTLNLSVEDPDLYANNLTVGYVPSSSGTGTFSVEGYPSTFTIAGTNSQYTMSSSTLYDLTAEINQSTGQATSGTLAIEGTIMPLGATTGTLLTGNLSQFGYQTAGGDSFEFVFNVTGGDLAPYYSGQIGVILAVPSSSFLGDFSTSFNNGSSPAYSDNFSFPTAVPEPCSAVLLGAIGCALVLLNRRFHRRSAAN